MKNKLTMLGMGIVAMASPMFAQANANASTTNDYRIPAAFIAMGIASGLCGLGQAKAVASSAEAMARNPGATAAIRFALILGLVLIESLALYTLVISYVVKGG
jgi:F-type H+-transporting ATPase subunit c